MTEIAPTIVPLSSVEPIIYGVLKLAWRDGLVGLVDLRPVLAEGEMFAFLRRNEARFFAVALDPHGLKVAWIDDEGDEIDFGTQSLRARAERQAALLRLAS